MRSILQNTIAYDMILKLGVRTGTVQQTITGTYTMAADQPTTLRLSAASAQTCILPAITGATNPPMDGRIHIIEAIGAAAITVQSASADGSVNIATVEPQEAVMFEADATNTTWRTIGAGSSGGAGIPLANTAITTVGNGTLTAPALTSGVITRSGPTSAYTDTTATAAAVAAAMTPPVVGVSWLVSIKNTVAFNETLAAGTGVTLSGQTIVPPNSVGTFLWTQTSATAATMQGIEAVPLTTPPLEANTAISTAGAGVLTAAAIVGGVITRTGPTGAYTDTLDTTTNIIAALPNANPGQSFELTIKNTVGFNATLAAGDGSTTLSGQTIIPPNSVGRFLVRVATATTLTVQGLGFMGMTVPPLLTTTSLTTNGAGTVTAAGIAGGVTLRTGVSSGTAFTDTLDTTTNILAALPNVQVGQALIYTYKNATNAVATIAAGDGSTTLAGITAVQPGQWAEFLVQVATATTLTITGYAEGPIVAMQASKLVTNSTAGATTAAVGDLTGSYFQCLKLTAVGAANYQVRTAAQLFGDIPNCYIGFSWMIAVKNTNAGTTTITADGGATVTLTGTMTVAQNTTRLLQATFTSATALAIESLGVTATA